MARRILSVYKLIGDFVERHGESDDTDFFQTLRDEVEGAEVGDYIERIYMDIIYGDYIFSLYWVDSHWELSDDIVLLVDDDNNASNVLIKISDIN